MNQIILNLKNKNKIKKSLLIAVIFLNSQKNFIFFIELLQSKKHRPSYYRAKTLAEDTGFEPVVDCSTPVFETGTFDHSDNLPLH